MYNYQTERKVLFTEDGLRAVIKTRDAVRALLKEAGACTMGKILDKARVGLPSSWEQMACVDYLVEQKEIREITGNDVAGQFRVFISTREL